MTPKNNTDVINQSKRIWLTDKEYVDSHGIDKIKEKLDVDASEVKDYDIESGSEGNNTNKSSRQINQSTFQELWWHRGPIPSRIPWRQPCRRSGRSSRNKDEGWRSSQASSCILVMDNVADRRTLFISVSAYWYCICSSISCFCNW
jgi:hypothetical protein